MLTALSHASSALVTTYILRQIDHQGKRSNSIYERVIFKQGGLSLPGEKFDGTRLNAFLTKVTSRAASFGISNVLTADNKLITEKYAEVKIEQVRLHAQTYQDLQGRDAQNTEILYYFILASSTEEVLTKVTADADSYRLEGNGTKAVNFLLFLKRVIDETYSNTLANAQMARENLSNLHEFMRGDPKKDITKINIYANEQQKEL